MATVLEKCITEEQRPVVSFLCAKRLSANDIRKEMCPVKFGSVCRVKRFHLGGKRFTDNEKVENKVRKWLRQQSKKISVLRDWMHW
jgi:hypothetical protein